jgi:chitodextrinase
VVLMLLAFAAHASTASVSWTHPTQNTDGTAIPASGTGALASSRVEFGSCGGGGTFGTAAGQVTVNAPATSTTITGLAPATTYCFRVFARNTFGNESEASNVASKTTPTPTPNPPVLSATITVAYSTMQRARRTHIRQVVGTVEIGAPCVDNLIRTPQGDFYEIDRAYVELTSNPKSTIVTKCEWS